MPPLYVVMFSSNFVINITGLQQLLVVTCSCICGYDCFCQRTTDEKLVDIELQTSDYVGQDLTSFNRFLRCFNDFSLLFLSTLSQRCTRCTLICYPWAMCGHIGYCLFVCVFVRLQISPPRIKLAASNFALRFIGVQGRESPIFVNFAPPKAQNLTNRPPRHHLHADKTIEDNSSIVAVIWTCYLPSAGACRQ